MNNPYLVNITVITTCLMLDSECFCNISKEFKNVILQHEQFIFSILCRSSIEEIRFSNNIVLLVYLVTNPGFEVLYISI